MPWTCMLFHVQASCVMHDIARACNVMCILVVSCTCPQSNVHTRSVIALARNYICIPVVSCTCTQFHVHARCVMHVHAIPLYLGLPRARRRVKSGMHWYCSVELVATSTIPFPVTSELHIKGRLCVRENCWKMQRKCTWSRQSWPLLGAAGETNRFWL